jgi:DNA-binding CsgD family transcriptional regulator
LVPHGGGLERSSEIIGRDPDRRVVTGFLCEIASGSVALVIEGDPGIGKSTIWRDGIAQARDRDCTVLMCQPAGAEARMSFAALGDLLEPVIDEILPELSVPQRRALEVALLRSEIAESPRDQRGDSVAFLKALRLLSEQNEVLLAVDDAHWLDRPTARVVDFAMRRLPTERVGLLASVRLDVRRRSGIDLQRYVDAHRYLRLRLGPLSLAALHQILRARAGAALPRRVLLKVHELSGGNPFFAIELTRVLAARNEQLAPGEPLPVPGTLEELVAARLTRIPVRTREALLVIAALARPTSGMIDAFDPRWNACEVLAEAERRELIDIGRERIRFSHPLVSSTVYGRATAFERRRVHGRLAKIVADSEQAARHHALAAEQADEQVATRLDQAAETAAARGAPAAAAELCELAHDATPGELTGAARRRNSAAAHHHFAAGDWERARELAEKVIAEGASGGELARALHLLGKLRYYGDSFPEAALLLRRALEHAGDDAAVRAPIELDLIFALQQLEGFPAVAALARTALEHAQALDQPGLLAESLAVVVITDFLSGSGLDRQRLDQALAMEDRTRHVPVNLRPSLIAGLIMSWIGEAASACAMFDDLRELLIERGEESELPSISALGVSAHCWRGDLQTAARLAEETLDVARQLDTGVARANTLSGAATVNAYLGNADDAREQAQESIELFQRVGWQIATVFPLTALGFLYLSLNESAEADRALRPFVALLEQAGLGEPSSAPFLADEIEALVGIGELRLAESLLDTLEERARALDRAVSLAPAARCRGLLLAARGDLGGALGALRHALSEHERAPRPVEQARTLLLLGQLQRRANQRRAARETLERALEIFAQAGAAQWSKRTRGELARLGLRRRAGSGLTPSEEQVAAHAARGMTNREIAGALFISTKTVEANLARAYRKLDISSRAELGRRIAERERIAASKK